MLGLLISQSGDTSVCVSECVFLVIAWSSLTASHEGRFPLNAIHEIQDTYLNVFDMMSEWFLLHYCVGQHKGRRLNP